MQVGHQVRRYVIFIPLLGDYWSVVVKKTLRHDTLCRGPATVEFRNPPA